MTDEFLDALVDDDIGDLYENAPCGYLSTMPDGTIIKTNATFRRLVARDEDDLVGVRRFDELLSPGGRIYHETHFAPLLRMEGSVREIALEAVRPDGSRVPILVNAVLKRDDDGLEATWRIAVFDATERRRYEAELLAARDRARESEHRARELARTLQESLIPPAPPQIPTLDIAAAYRPAGVGDEVGGDFYDVFEAGRGDWAVVLGDVCGKGAGAATVTALARYTLRAAAVRNRRPRVILGLLNEALLRQGAERFCTVVYLRVRPRPGGARLTVSSAGHWLPLLLTSDGHIREAGRIGTVAGVISDVDLHDSSVDLGPGDAVVTFTDGVVEARRDGEEFGHERLRSVVSACSGCTAQELTDTVLDAVLGFQDGMPRDDIAVLVLRVPRVEY